MEKRLQLFERVFEEAPIGLEVLQLMTPGDIGSLTPIAVNRNACLAAGQDLKADIGKSWRETSPALVDSEFARLFMHCLETGEPVGWELNYGDDRFAASWFRGTGSRLQDDLLLVAFENISHSKRAQLELERSNQALDDFAYVASHDLKAPLRDVDNLASWLFADLADSLSGDSKRHLLTLRSRVQRMDRLLDDLLDYSRAGRVHGDLAGFDVADVVADAWQMLPKPAEMVGDLPTTGIRVHGPRQPLELVIRNLLGNAIKHHDRPGGCIAVAVDERPDHIEVSVTDDGPGIDPRFHERIFGMFQTLRPSDDVEGTGLGLAMVRKLVRAYGGTVTLTSSPGEGSTFAFTWPSSWAP